MITGFIEMRDEYSCRPVVVTLKFALVRRLTSHHYLSDRLISNADSAPV